MNELLTKTDLREFERQLTLRFGGMIAAFTVIVAVLIKLL